jgi:peroxiredoxin
MILGGEADMPMLLRTDSGGPVCGSSELSARLRGVEAPRLRLPFAPGEVLPGSIVSLAELSRRRSLVVFFYGGIAWEGAGQDPAGGVGVEGARLEGWREHEPELAELGYDLVGVSSQSSEVQTQFALDRMLLSFMFLSDRELLLADELGLPTGRGSGGERVYEPLTMLVGDGRISSVFYPLERPEFDSAIVIMRIRGLYA